MGKSGHRLRWTCMLFLALSWVAHESKASGQVFCRYPKIATPGTPAAAEAEETFIGDAKSYVLTKILLSHQKEKNVRECLNQKKMSSQCQSEVSAFVESHQKAFDLLQRLFIRSQFQIKGQIGVSTQSLYLEIPDEMFKFPRWKLGVNVPVPAVDPTTSSVINSSIRDQELSRLHEEFSVFVQDYLNANQIQVDLEQAKKWKLVPGYSLKLFALSEDFSRRSKVFLSTYQSIMQGYFYETLRSFPTLAFVEKWDPSEPTFKDNLKRALDRLQLVRDEQTRAIASWDYRYALDYAGLLNGYIEEQSQICGHRQVEIVANRILALWRGIYARSEALYDATIHRSLKYCAAVAGVAFLPPQGQWLKKLPMVQKTYQQMVQYAGKAAPFCAFIWATDSAVDFTADVSNLRQFRYELFGSPRDYLTRDQLGKINGQYNTWAWQALWNLTNVSLISTQYINHQEIAGQARNGLQFFNRSLLLLSNAERFTLVELRNMLKRRYPASVTTWEQIEGWTQRLEFGTKSIQRVYNECVDRLIKNPTTPMSVDGGLPMDRLGSCMIDEIKN